MTTTILTLHLALAATYIVTAATVGLASIKRKALPRTMSVAYASFGAIIGTGAVLIILSPKAIAQFCVSALAATAFGLAVSYAYRRRVITFHATENALY